MPMTHIPCTYLLLQKRMENSTETLKNLISSLEEEADPITALALFPLKSTDKKIAFVVGLVRVYVVYRYMCLLYDITYSIMYMM